MRTLVLIQVIITVLILCTGCHNNNRHHETLLAVDAIANADSTGKALQILKTVNRSQLSRADRYFYDFLLIKTSENTTDKSLTSDSLAQSIIEYYGKSGDTFKRAETYYVTGKSYRDNGDAPQAVDLFLKSVSELNHLDNIDNRRYKNLKSSVLNQLGDLLLRQRLFEQTLTIAKESLNNSLKSKDPTQIAYDASLIATTLFYLNQPDSAIYYFNYALSFSEHLSENDNSMLLYSIKNIEAKRGKYMKAKQQYDKILRTIPHESQARVPVLNLGALIYYKCNLLDSARYCIDELLNNYGPENHRKAYEILLEMNCLMGRTDSLTDIVKKYNEASNLYYNDLDKNAIAQQYSLYNYSVKDKKLKDYKIKQQQWWIIIVTLCLAFASSIITIIGLLYLNNKKQLNLSIAQNNILRLESILNYNDSSILNYNDYDTSIQALTETLKRKIEYLRTNHKNDITVPVQITSSDIYRQLKSMVFEGHTITSNNDILERLDIMVQSVSPSFKNNLMHLLPTISEGEYHISLLVKCGFTPTEISKLLSKSLSAISCTRSRMFERVFHYKEPPATWDLVIKLI